MPRNPNIGLKKMRFDDHSRVMLFRFSLNVKRKPSHKWNQQIYVEAMDRAHASEVVLYEYPKGVIWDIENMDAAY